MNSNIINTTLGRIAAGLVISGGLLAVSAIAADHEEGGYAGTSNQGHTTVVWNFLRHFSYEQYYYSAYHQWTYNNDNRVDAMDFAIFAGHGSPWYFVGQDGYGVDLRYVGNGADGGYGDRDCEFVAFQSCKVVPSPLETSNWAYNWTRSSGVFEGLHQALGFRTNSYQSTDQDVTNLFGIYVKYNYGIWQSWFTSINVFGRSDEHGCAVMYPTAQNDTYANFIADPPANSTWLRCWYQY